MGWCRCGCGCVSAGCGAWNRCVPGGLSPRRVPLLPARSRLTGRLRVKVTAGVTATNRAISEVAAERDLAWGTVHRILVAAAAVIAVGQAADDDDRDR